ncbi:MAG: FtsX-like permease family protein [Pseudomonadales bacterium]|nr:FtsX-like permease family protein [Pseudomonadales bacterium]
MQLAVRMRFLWRDWKGGELGLLFASLAIAVAIITSITLFIDRLQGSILSGSAAFIGADQLLSSPEPIDALWIAEAKKQKLKISEAITFQSMVFADDQMLLADLKAVDQHYPLKGQMGITKAAFEEGVAIDHGPNPGEVWVESRLLPALGLSVGDMLSVGESELTIGAVITNEPDRGGGMFGVGPRVMMNLADIAQTGIIQPGSRVQYRFMYSGDESNLEQFTQWLRPKLNSSQQLLGVKEGRPAISKSIERAEKFLMLACLLGVVMAAVALAMASRRYCLRQYNYVAVMKSFGASSREINRLYMTKMIGLGVLASLFGAFLGWLTQVGFVWILQDYLPEDLPPAHLRPWLIGVATGLVCLVSFVFPPLIDLKTVSPLRVIRRDLEPPGNAALMIYGLGILGTFCLMWWYGSDLMLALSLMLGGLAAIAVMTVLIRVVLSATRAAGMQAGSQWKLAMAAIQRRKSSSTLQIMTFSLAILLLLVIATVRTSLVEKWQNQVPETAPNYFLMNISAHEREPLRDHLQNNGIEPHPFYPVVLGRLNSVNDRSMVEHMGKEPRGNEHRRALNLSWSDTLSPDNKIVEGSWWTPEDYGKSLLSVEQEIATRFKLSVGDQMQFTVADQILIATVHSIRSVQWDSMNPNFYFMFPPGLLDNHPATYLSSFYLPRSDKAKLNGVVRNFPTITLLDLDAVINQVRSIINQVSLAVELVLGMILFSGVLVLIASIRSSLDERFHENAILRTLGASRKLIMGSLLIEFALLGFIAGLLAAVGAELTLYMLQSRIFLIEYSFHPMIWIGGPFTGALLIGFIGTLVSYRVVKVPPITILRELA